MTAGAAGDCRVLPTRLSPIRDDVRVELQVRWRVHRTHRQWLALLSWKPGRSSEGNQGAASRIVNMLAVASLALITLFAAAVNGALGYGFSSITVPVALLLYTNRILNPALVLIEVTLNSYMLFINRKSVPLAWKRVLHILWGLIPGVLAGSYLLSSVNPGWLKFFTYAILLPLIILQAAGVRKPIDSERTD
jgi:Sulfite exporter TauE/SafE